MAVPQQKSPSPRRWVKKLFIIVGSILALLIIGASIITSGLWYPGLTHRQSAEILFGGGKFESRAMFAAYLYGDGFLDAIREVSNDFEKMHTDTAPLVGILLAYYQTEKATAISHELYRRDRLPEIFAGAIGLAGHGKLDLESPDARGAVLGALGEGNNLADVFDDYRSDRDSTYKRLALIALGTTRDDQYAPLIIRVLKNTKHLYIERDACDALAMIGSREAVPVLIAALEDPDFGALSNAFMSLVALNEKKAVPTAIARLSRDDDEPILLRYLVSVTGVDFETDFVKWREWWDSNGDEWEIPERFLSINMQPHSLYF